MTAIKWRDSKMASPRRVPMHSRGEVIVSKDVVIVVIAVVIGEEAFLPQEVVGLEDHGLTDLQREDPLVCIALDHASAHVLGLADHLPTKVSKDGRKPFFTRQLA